jgi:predicted DNA-binding protein (UPF0251 family)
MRCGDLDHEMYGTRLYRIWRGMIDRCENNNSKSYKWYGGRGIKVCDDWHTPQKFFGWAFLNGYHANLTIDRINNDKGYCPDNCRWVNNFEQQRNRRNIKRLTFKEQTLTVQEWADLMGISKSTINSRLKQGWSIEDTLTCRPHSKDYKSNETFLCNGEVLRLTEISKKYGVNRETLRYRLSKGMSIEKALAKEKGKHITRGAESD